MSAIVDSYPLLPLTLPLPLRALRRYLSTAIRPAARTSILEFGAFSAMPPLHTMTSSPLRPSPALTAKLPVKVLLAVATAPAGPHAHYRHRKARHKHAPAKSPIEAAHPVHASRIVVTHRRSFLCPSHDHWPSSTALQPEMPLHSFQHQSATIPQ